jgi:anthranilate synthase component 2
VFSDIPQNIAVMRYHSLVVDPKSLPDCLKITARANDTREIMGLKHTTYPIEGIQFHPESFATDAGKMMLENFLFRK